MAPTSYLMAPATRDRPINFSVPVGGTWKVSDWPNRVRCVPLDQSTVAWGGVCNNMAAPVRTSWLESGAGGKRAGQVGWVDDTIDVHHGGDKCPNRGANKVLWEFRGGRHNF